MGRNTSPVTEWEQEAKEAGRELNGAESIHSKWRIVILTVITVISKGIIHSGGTVEMSRIKLKNG